MKKLLSLMTLTAIAVCVPTGSMAAEKKAKPAAEAVQPAAEKAVAPAPEKVAGMGKALPMNSRADAIDVKAKTFTMTRKDGVAVKHVITDTTTIMNGEAPAKLEDIKVGDYVAGLRLKKGDNEYEVVKITKFGPKTPKAAPAEKKPE